MKILAPRGFCAVHQRQNKNKVVGFVITYSQGFHFGSEPSPGFRGIEKAATIESHASALGYSVSVEFERRV